MSDLPARLAAAESAAARILGRLRPPSLAALRRLPRTFWILWAGMLVNRLAGFVVPFLALYLTRQRGLSVATAGAVTAMFGLGACGAGPIAGWLADHWGRRNTMLLGLVCGSIFTASLAYASDPIVLGALVLGAGLLGELYRPAMHAAVSDVVAPEDRGRAFGLVYWAVNLAFAVGVSAAGWFVGNGNSYSVLYLIDAATTLCFAAVIALTLPETRPVAPPSTPTAPRPAAFVVLRDPEFRGFLALNVGMSLVFLQFLVALPLDMTAKGIPASNYGSLIALNGVLIVLLQPLVADSLGALPARKVLAVASVLIAVGVGLHAPASSAPAFAAAIAIWTLGEIAYMPTATAYVAELAPEDARGRYQGAYSLSWSIGNSAATFAGSLVLGSAGSLALWALCCAGGLIVAGGHALASRRVARRGLQEAL